MILSQFPRLHLSQKSFFGARKMMTLFHYIKQQGEGNMKFDSIFKMKTYLVTLILFLHTYTASSQSILVKDLNDHLRISNDDDPGARQNNQRSVIDDKISNHQTQYSCKPRSVRNDARDTNTKLKEVGGLQLYEQGDSSDCVTISLINANILLSENQSDTYVSEYLEWIKKCAKFSNVHLDRGVAVPSKELDVLHECKKLYEHYENDKKSVLQIDTHDLDKIKLEDVVEVPPQTDEKEEYDIVSVFIDFPDGHHAYSVVEVFLLDAENGYYLFKLRDPHDPFLIIEVIVDGNGKILYTHHSADSLNEGRIRHVTTEISKAKLSAGAR
jgi:hypothetical protein